MALTVQGSKHVLLGDKDLSYGPGQSLLTTIDLPVSYHITCATATEPCLGIMLKFDRNLITQVASKIEMCTWFWIGSHEAYNHLLARWR